MTSNPIWHFYNNLNQKQLPNIHDADVAPLLNSWKSDDLKFWFAWQPGWDGWRQVQEIPELVAMLQPKAETPPAPPVPQQSTPPPTPPPAAPAANALSEMLVNSIETPAATPTIPVSGQVTEVSGRDKRVHKRYDLRLRVILTNGKSTFRTFTKNISLGGVFLEHPVPANILNTKCEIYIASLDSGTHIKFETVVVSNTPDGPKHFSFSQVDTLFLDQLAQWLATFEQNKVQAG